MAFSPTSAGVVYRCPLCSQCFAGRPRPPLAAGAEKPLVPDIVTMTAAIARSDPRVIEHLQSHSVTEWLLKVDALERDAQVLRELVHARPRRIRNEQAANESAS